MRTVLLVPWFVAISSCSSPPKPPTVDESNRRPANTAQAVELQTCKSDLQNTRILAAESTRLAQSAAITAAALQERQQALVAFVSSRQPKQDAAGNEVFALHFSFGSTELAVSPAVSEALLAAVRDAPLVILRGRTDGTTDSAVESRIARQRAAAVRDYLVAAGVERSRIRATHQPVGDHAADNSTEAGRGLNRRVEIEVYRVMPVAFGAKAAETTQP